MQAGRESKDHLASAAAFTRGVHRTGEAIEAAYLGAKADEEALRDFLSQKEILYPLESLHLPAEPDANGVEARAYLNWDSRSVLKINSGIHHPNWLDFFLRLLAHNLYFPESSYKLLGFIEEPNGRIAALLEQQLIEFVASATVDEIRDDLQSRGFIFQRIHHAEDVQNGVILRDLHQENVVMLANGNVVYIDPLIQFTEESEFVRAFLSG